jgi:hypothetical protein
MVFLPQKLEIHPKKYFLKKVSIKNNFFLKVLFLDVKIKKSGLNAGFFVKY